jgi:outer membrane protein assembly factor BamB
MPAAARRFARNAAPFTAALIVCAAIATQSHPAENWPRWRGPDGNAVSPEVDLPVRWSPTANVRWKAATAGEGSSSPIVWGDAVFVTAAFQQGARRTVFCCERETGRERWRHELRDADPEIASSLTGHAAATPVTDGLHVVAAFGNAGVVCCNFTGKQLWHRRLGTFESELGLASSPILHDGLVILVCDHDGDRFRSFDSFLIALDVETGETRWKTDRPGLFRSWSTPIVVPLSAQGDQQELIVAAQDELRGYDLQTGKQRWHVSGMAGWVTPSPVFGRGLIFASSGKDGPTLAVRPGGTGDAAATHVAWKDRRGGPYVCSPLLYGDHLYVHNESGVLTCYRAGDGGQIYRRRLEGKFLASAAAGDGKLYLTNEQGVTFVVKAGPQFEILAANDLTEESLASPAIAGGRLYLRTRRHLYCIGSDHLPDATKSGTAK